MAGTLPAITLRVPRSRGAFSGVLLILLGLWGGLVPLIGPYVHYDDQPDKAWTVTAGRAWLEFLPAACAVVGGIVLLASRLRPWALLGASLAVLSGAWFALGSVIVRFGPNPPTLGAPVGGTVARAAEQIGFFTGLGVVIVCVAAVAIGRFSVHSVRDRKMAERMAMTEPKAVVPDTFTTEPAGTSSPAKKTPMAVLTRIAGRTRQVQPTDGLDAAPRPEQVNSGAGRS